MTVYLYNVGIISGTLIGVLGTFLYCFLINGLRGMPASQLFHEEQLAGHGGDTGRGDSLGGAVTQSHPEAHALPLHTAVEAAVGAADGVVSLEHKAGADGVGTAGNHAGAASEGDSQSIYVYGYR